MKTFAAALALAALCACSLAGDILKLPEGWRLPDRQQANETWRNGIPGRGLSITADFDGNGTPDLAYLLENERDATAGVWVYMNGDKRNGQLIAYGAQAGAVKISGIREEKPGAYPTPCGKAGDCAPDQPKEIVFKYPAIDLFVNQGGHQYLYWDARSEGFKKSAIGG